MAQVAVTIAGKTYRVACDEGEELRLGDLASFVDRRIEDMRQRFGEIGDRRLTIMAALTIADELQDASRRVQELERGLAEVESELAKIRDGRQDWVDRIAAGITAAAERIERVAGELGDGAEVEALRGPEIR